jgi:tellurite resistance protein
MQEFFPELEIRQDQAEAIARGLYAVAKADGTVHDREAAIIAEFYGSTTTTASDLGALERAPTIEGSALAAFLPGTELRKLFLKTAILLAYADSSYAPNEQKIINDYAKALAIAPADVTLLEQQVKEYLLSQLVHLSNVQAAALVAKELKI